MPLHVAFLRAINVGGRIVRMDALRTIFADMGLEDVQTFIASGNVIFRSRRATRTLEPRIEKQLRATLGWEVATFLRSAPELRAIARDAPFDAGEGTTHVGLLRNPPSVQARRELESIASATDEIRVHGRDVYWLIRGRMMESAVSAARIEKLLGAPMTVRTLNTVRRIGERVGDG